MSEGSNNPDGGPTKYKPEFNEQAYRLCLLGATDKEIGDFFDVCERTINYWKLEDNGFVGSLKKGKIICDAGISEKLHERAYGFKYQEAHPIKLKEIIYQDGKKIKEIERVEIVMVDKVVPQDTTALKFWLTNRRPGNWRDKVDVENSGEIRYTKIERVIVDHRNPGEETEDNSDEVGQSPTPETPDNKYTIERVIAGADSTD